MAYGISTVLVKLISDRESVMTITAYQTLFGGFVLILMGMALGGEVSGGDFKSVCLMLYMSILSTGSFSIWTILLKYNPVGQVAIYGFTIPIFGVLFSAIFLGEQIVSIQNIAALVLVSAGIWLTYRKPCKEKEETVQ